MLIWIPQRTTYRRVRHACVRVRCDVVRRSLAYGYVQTSVAPRLATMGAFLLVTLASIGVVTLVIMY